MVNAVVLAGGKEKLGHYKSKATLEFNNKRCIDYVVEALEDAEHVDNFLIIGDRYSLGKDIKQYQVIQEKKSFFQNAVHGYFESPIKKEDPLFYIYSDIPFVTSESIDDFLERCDLEVDLNFGLVNIEKIRENFPGYKENYPHARFKDFDFRMANCALVYPKKVLDSEFEKKHHTFKNAYKGRRFDQKGSMIRFAINSRHIFLYHLLKNFRGYSNGEFYFNTTIRDLENYIFNKTKLKFNFIKSNYSELAVDVDTRRDKEYIENYLT